MPIRYHTINDVKVNRVALPNDEDTRLPQGYKLFDTLNANIFLCAKKFSGKSCCASKIIEECGSKDTMIMVFSTTLYKDPTFKAIRKMCKKKGFPFTGYESLKDEDGMDIIDMLVENLNERAQENFDDSSDESSDEEEIITTKRRRLVSVGDDSEDEEKPKKKKRSKYKHLDYIFLFDDIAPMLKSNSLVQLMKTQRHYSSKILINSQAYNDILPAQRLQCDYFLIWGAFPEHKLYELWRDAQLSIEFEDFVKLYKEATSKPHSFLYIDARKQKFRKNFNKEIEIE